MQSPTRSASPPPSDGWSSCSAGTASSWNSSAGAGGDARLRKWSSMSPISSSVKTLFRRRRSSSTAETVSVFYLWDTLPESVRFHIVEFLSVRDLTAVSAVSWEACHFSRSDVLWRRLFMEKFSACDLPPPADDFFVAYRDRYCVPCVGDKVQVLWEGSFNLISDVLMSYAGRAWWEAEVVERTDDCTSFKIHYPHWDASTWDEWVPRLRIRWPPDADDGQLLQKGDVVEHKCASALGVSPWLECVVEDIMGDHFHLGDAILSDNKVVLRSTLRFVSRKHRRFTFPKIGGPRASFCAVM